MEQPSKMRSILGGVFTAVKWLAGAALVAGAIAFFLPETIVGVALLGGSTATGFGAFLAGAKGLFALGGLASAIPAGIGLLGFTKGAISTHRGQQMEIMSRQMAAAAAQQQGQGPSQSVARGAAKGISFEATAGHPAEDRERRGVKFTTEITNRQQQTAARSPGS